MKTLLDIGEKKNKQKVFIDWTGKRFGRWLVLGVHSKRKEYGGVKVYWLCKCDCGKEKVVSRSSLKSGHSKSCGCLHNEQLRKKLKTHGMSGKRFYTIWVDMKKRCLNPNRSYWKNYGGRGIKVCKKWEKFENYKNDMYKNYLKHLKEFGIKQTSIDRINNNGNYCKENCRWATRKEQSANSRRCL